MSEQITTAEEMDALPVGSVVLSEAYRRDTNDVRYRCAFQRLYDGAWYRGGRFRDTEVAYILPAVILHRPDAPAPTDEDRDALAADLAASVARGLTQSASGETVALGDFTQYAEDREARALLDELLSDLRHHEALEGAPLEIRSWHGWSDVGARIVDVLDALSAEVSRG